MIAAIIPAKNPAAIPLAIAIGPAAAELITNAANVEVGGIIGGLNSENGRVIGDEIVDVGEIDPEAGP